MTVQAPSAGESSLYRHQGGGAPLGSALGRRIWLITFTDLVSLMLAFFVMLFAMSGMKIEVWEATILAISRTENPSRIPLTPPVAAHNVSTTARTAALDLDYLATLFHRIGRGSTAFAETRLVRTPDALIVVLNADEIFTDDLFGNDKTGLSATAMQTLSAVADLLRNFSNRIGVRLHVDPEDALDAGHASTWERALIGAAMVANNLRAAGYDRAIAADAVLDRDLATSAGRMEPEKSERAAQIEIVILPEQGATR